MREPLEFTAEERAEDAAFYRIYGPWDPLDVEGARELLDGFERPWWLVGGYAIEAFTGALREHEDIDVSMLACDAPLLRGHVGDRWHLWTNVSGQLRLEEATWMTDEGVRVLNPEIVLLFKSTNGRPKDLRDFERALPLLGAGQRDWLRDAIARLRADHPWLAMF